MAAPIHKRLRRLVSRISELEDRYLPSTFSLTGRYSRRQRDDTKAFLLLVHAELESYFEDRVRKIAEKSADRYRRSGFCTPVLSRLILYYHAFAQKKFEPVSQNVMQKAMNLYLDRVQANNGIKEKDLLGLFLPLGISHQAMDTQLVTACNQLGQKRGEFAHASFKTHQQIDPKTERDNIRNNILPELRKLERVLRKLS